MRYVRITCSNGYGSKSRGCKYLRFSYSPDIYTFGFYVKLGISWAACGSPGKLCSRFFFGGKGKGFALHRLNEVEYFIRFRGFFFLIFAAAIESLIFHIYPLVDPYCPLSTERYKRKDG